MSELPPREQPPRDQAISVAAISPERPDNHENDWTRRLVLFLRVMAVLSVAKGLYHWAQITGFVGGEDDAFEVQTMAWQTATIYFAVIELVAAVGLWLATPWGAVVWLTTVVSMAVIELMFPTIYALGIKGLGPNTKLGGSIIIMAIIGGAVWTPLMGLISDTTHSMALAMLVPLTSYIFIIYYSFVGAKPAGPLYGMDDQQG